VVTVMTTRVSCQNDRCLATEDSSIAAFAAADVAAAVAAAAVAVSIAVAFAVRKAASGGATEGQLVQMWLYPEVPARMGGIGPAAT